jgi:hypothetical protein
MPLPFAESLLSAIVKNPLDSRASTSTSELTVSSKIEMRD